MQHLKDGVHFDLSLEKAILGACLLEPKAFSSVQSLLEEDFLFDTFHKMVFTALSDMYTNGEQIDIITVTHNLRKKKITEYNGENVPYLLTGLMIDVVSTAHLEVHSLILREMYMERELTRISHSKFEGDAIEKAEAIQTAIKRALTVNGVDDWKSISEVMISLEKHRNKVRDRELMGVPSSFPTIDRITGGFQEGQIIIVGARPSVGKSAFIGGIAVNAAQKGHKVGVISLEMPDEQIGARLASIYSDIEFYKIYRSIVTDFNEEKRLIDSMVNIGSLPLFITDKTNVTASAIRAKAEKLKKRGGLDLLIIDYLQLIETESKNNQNREREVANLSRSMKLLAMDLKIPIIVLCQLNRQSETDGKAKKPRMSQIRESGSLEQDADVVMLLHREWKSGILTDEQGNNTERKATIIIEKNRNGETMDLDIGFNPELMKFYEEQEQMFTIQQAPQPFVIDNPRAGFQPSTTLPPKEFWKD